MKLLIGAALLLLLFAALEYKIYMMAFRAPKGCGTDPYHNMDNPCYDPYRDRIETNLRRLIALPYETVSIRSKDGLRLCGRFYEFTPGAPTAVFMHGWH